MSDADSSRHTTGHGERWIEDGFDIDGFLGKPLVARLATSPSSSTPATERHWHRFQNGVFDDPTTRFVVLEPTRLRARDLSY